MTANPGLAYVGRDLGPHNLTTRSEFMRRCLGFFAIGLVTTFSIAAQQTGAQNKDEPVRVLFVLNGHDFGPKAPILEKLLKDLGGFQVTPQKDLKKLEDVKRADYDVLLFYGSPQSNELQDRAIAKFVEDGGGVVALHHASAGGSKDWIRLIGGRFAGHIAGTHKLNVVVTDKDHPVTKGIDAFTIEDEEYKHSFADVERKVLAKFRERPEKSDQKANMDILWTREVGKGKVVYTGLGHGKEAFENPAWQKLVAQAILWTAGKPREVKIPEAK
jgi:type 1 glutamine amidotransferase